MKHLFGPVPSRRLGRSLGIDVIPYKTCTFDCVYCECGATTNKTCSRSEFFPLSELLDELEEGLSRMRSKPDVVTLSGAGEPTLYERTGELIREAKRLSGLPVAVITNSSLLDRPDVREELLEADILLPSLDTTVEETFRLLNRPHAECNLPSIIDGMEILLGQYRGRVLFEILLLDGFNTDDENLAGLKRITARLPLDSIQINTAVRPGTEKGIGPLAPSALQEIAALFGPRAEVIAGVRTEAASREDRAIRETIISMLRRRPCTPLDISTSLGIPVPETAKILEQLVLEGTLSAERHGEALFYSSVEK
jgi:wyosine [tRNA(Phe)-imidazoG37] synthetase (radical SAM superfamily)